MKILNRVRSLSRTIFKEKLLCSMAFNMHDSSVSFALGNKVVLVLEAERVFRKKKKLCSHQDMEYLIKYGLNILNKKIEDVSYWSMTTLNNPYLTRFDIVDFEKKKIREPYWKKIELFGSEKKVLIVNHHLAHAAIYLSTQFKSAIIISCDGGGDFNESTKSGECLVVYTAKGDVITRQDLPYSDFITGKIYGAAATFLYNSKYSEGKMMALAGFGQSRPEYYDFFAKNFKSLETKDYRQIDRFLEQTFPSLKGSASSQSKDALDFAASVHEFFIQKRLEDTDMIMKKLSTAEALILAGGVALNLDLNTKIFQKYPNLKHFIAPCCDDTGQSLGALCLLINTVLKIRPEIHFPYLGEGAENFEYTSETLDQAVDLLLKDGILILHNGKSEIGPRALGNRSFIARPDSLEVKKKLSEKIKERESYRPVAPIVLEDKVNEYFIGPKESPYMLHRYEIVESQKNKIIGAVHIDNSARAQTITRTMNPFLYDLIKRFGDRTGIYVVLNTSLNLKGEPITNTIEQSLAIYEKIDDPKIIIHNGVILKN